jgi:DNA mismatch repair protein MutL
VSVDPQLAPRRPIRRLDRSTVERIAAGEVAERPASVVKELLENSIDAEATSITVRIERGGMDRIEVADDGFGILPEELGLAVERHATSKLDPAGPIEKLESLGFRGEALAAIAAVGRMRIVSRVPPRDAAAGISVAGGEPGRPFVGSRAPGTTVEVTELFFNTPARRKFLRSPAAEQVEVARVVERVYLAHPSVTVRFIAEDREIATYPATRDLRDAGSRVLGPPFRDASFGVDAMIPGGRVEGYLGRPALAASSSRGLYLAVNGRAVDARPLAQAIRVAFTDYLPRGRFPVGVLHLTLDPSVVDVNVHPTKREVRLARPGEVAEALRGLSRAALRGSPQVGGLPEASGPSRSRAGTRFAPGARAAPESLEAPRGSAPVLRTVGQRTLGPPLDAAEPAVVAATPGHPRLHLLGCVQALYWIAEGDDGVVLIDQHAASERILFESLRREVALARQSLVEPVLVRLTGVERATLEAHHEDVGRAGFDLAPFGPEVHAVRSVPSFAGRRSRAESVVELLDELAAGGRPTQPDGLVERTAASLACHAAIRAGDVVTAGEFSRVLDALYALPEAAYACPHGRPIVLDIPRTRLDRWFLRSGP